MKITKWMVVLFLIVHHVSAQKNKQISFAVMNTNSAMPFSKFGSLVTGVVHPGIEAGYGFNWKTKKKHDWYQEIKLAYFYHRFVQQAIPAYTDFGYRYKFSKKITAQFALGAGYLHSIPATAKLKLGSDGEYKNDKDIGRSQTMVAVNTGLAYCINPSAKKPVKIFTTYQQMIQMPFVKAYVPLLPYNSLLVGISMPLQQKNKS